MIKGAHYLKTLWFLMGLPRHLFFIIITLSLIVAKINFELV